MTRPDFESDPLFDGLADDAQAPDLTGRIMGRLGYMRVVPEAARKRRRRLVTSRSAVMSLLLLAMAVGIGIHNNSNQARRPEAVTLPSAVESDREHLRRLFQPVRGFSVPAGQTPERADHADLERVNLLPFPMV